MRKHKHKSIDPKYDRQLEFAANEFWSLRNSLVDRKAEYEAKKREATVDSEVSEYTTRINELTEIIKDVIYIERGLENK